MGEVAWRPPISDARPALHRLLMPDRRTPLFAMLAMVTSALGIGRNAVIFGVVKSVLLDSLPYRDASRLL